MYRLVFDDEAVEFLEKLPRDMRKRIFNKIISTKEKPLHFFERLSGRNDYRLRVGDYRVIADIDKRTMQIQVTLIGHRRNVYKKVRKSQPAYNLQHVTRE